MKADLLLGIRCVIFVLSAFACSIEASADDIALRVGARFSVYAPSSCRRADRVNFSLVLDCDFRGKAAHFFMKEFPAQLSETFDPRKDPPSNLNKATYLDSALRSIVDEFDPGIAPRLTILASGSTREDVDALFWEEGYISSEDTKNSENIGKCVFLRVQAYRRGLSAVLLAISDGGRLGPESAWSECRRTTPGEVLTILGSIGDVFEGGI
jgi:hypothetical protein